MGSARFLLVAALAAGLACLAGGCDGDDPAGIDYHHRELQVDWAFPDVPDSVFVLTEIASGEGWHPLEVFASVLPSDQGSPLVVRLHIVGGTYDPDREPYLESRWATDTLRIWCAAYPREWDLGLTHGAKTSPMPEFFSIDRIDLVPPPGAVVQYVGEAYVGYP